MTKHWFLKIALMSLALTYSLALGALINTSHSNIRHPGLAAADSTNKGATGDTVPTLLVNTSHSNIRHQGLAATDSIPPQPSEIVSPRDPQSGLPTGNKVVIPGPDTNRPVQPAAAPKAKGIVMPVK